MTGELLAGTVGARGYIGVLLLVTVAAGFCPAYPLLGMNACPMKKTRATAKRPTMRRAVQLEARINGLDGGAPCLPAAARQLGGLGLGGGDVGGGGGLHDASRAYQPPRGSWVVWAWAAVMVVCMWLLQVV